MTSVALAVRVRLPLAPVIVRGYVPIGLVLRVVIVSVQLSGLVFAVKVP